MSAASRGSVPKGRVEPGVKSLGVKERHLLGWNFFSGLLLGGSGICHSPWMSGAGFPAPSASRAAQHLSQSWQHQGKNSLQPLTCWRKHRCMHAWGCMCIKSCFPWMPGASDWAALNEAVWGGKAGKKGLITPSVCSWIRAGCNQILSN